MRRAFAHMVAAGEPDGVRFDFDRVASAPRLPASASTRRRSARSSSATPARETCERAGGSRREAAELGIGGVPYYVIDGRYAVCGGQPAEVWLRTLDAIEAESGCRRTGS